MWQSIFSLTGRKKSIIVKADEVVKILCRQPVTSIRVEYLNGIGHLYRKPGENPAQERYCMKQVSVGKLDIFAFKSDLSSRSMYITPRTQEVQ